MPSWSIHLAIAKKVNEVLKLDNDLFLYGNLIPDVDTGTPITRYEAHYYDEKLPYPTVPQETMINLDKFLSVYKDKLDNHLILGYYSHLLTDQFYNNLVYTTRYIQDDKLNIIGLKLKNNKTIKLDVGDRKRLRRKYKHEDFELYGKYLYNSGEVEIPKNINIIKENINILANHFLNEELVDYRYNYLNNGFNDFNKLSIKEKIFKHNYKMFTKEELDNYMTECINMIIKNIKEIIDKE